MRGTRGGSKGRGGGWRKGGGGDGVEGGRTCNVYYVKLTHKIHLALARQFLIVLRRCAGS